MKLLSKIFNETGKKYIVKVGNKFVKSFDYIGWNNGNKFNILEYKTFSAELTDNKEECYVFEDQSEYFPAKDYANHISKDIKQIYNIKPQVICLEK